MAEILVQMLPPTPVTYADLIFKALGIEQSNLDSTFCGLHLAALDILSLVLTQIEP